MKLKDCYTSKTSALDLELPCKHELYVGKRVKRGLFRSSTGKAINADINGSICDNQKEIPRGINCRGNSELRRERQYWLIQYQDKSCFIFLQFFSYGS
ncbi:hypothetical protein [Okeania sp. KiyG1]|uniref:hypothetical protein n=1 Tax=Okeania sp. KiyG1 TaxID=2720165 RepID=UPI00192206C9|nr:hypothetical protein [Okeania sp. KiyG1]